MARSGCGTAMSGASIAISASVFLLTAAAGAARGDDLKGYSIDATYTTQTVPGAMIAGDLPRHGLSPVQHHDRIYISVLGNVFDYSDKSSGEHAQHGGNETQLDKAKTISGDRMQAWTVESGRLLRITHLVEGTAVETFAVDAGTTACTVSFQTYPDPNTGRVVTRFLMGAIGEVRAVNLSLGTCTVRKGNIFAADQ
jgi:hypothetical protein